MLTAGTASFSHNLTADTNTASVCYRKRIECRNADKKLLEYIGNLEDAYPLLSKNYPNFAGRRFFKLTQICEMFGTNYVKHN